MKLRFICTLCWVLIVFIVLVSADKARPSKKDRDKTTAKPKLTKDNKFQIKVAKKDKESKKSKDSDEDDDEKKKENVISVNKSTNVNVTESLNSTRNDDSEIFRRVNNQSYHYRNQTDFRGPDIDMSNSTEDRRLSNWSYHHRKPTPYHGCNPPHSPFDQVKNELSSLWSHVHALHQPIHIHVYKSSRDSEKHEGSKGKGHGQWKEKDKSKWHSHHHSHHHSFHNHTNDTYLNHSKHHHHDKDNDRHQRPSHPHHGRDYHRGHDHEHKGSDYHHGHDHEHKGPDYHHGHDHGHRGSDYHHGHDHEHKGPDYHHRHDHGQRGSDYHHGHDHEHKGPDYHHGHGHDHQFNNSRHRDFQIHETHIHLNIQVSGNEDKHDEEDHKDRGHHKNESETQYKPVYARCDMHTFNSGNDVGGTVWLTQQPGDDMTVEVQLHGLEPNPSSDEYFVNEMNETVVKHKDKLHGFHIHEFGDLSKGCASLGGHFNPEGVDHGYSNHNAHGHVGDWGNLQADENGKVNITFSVKEAKLIGPDSIIGRGIVVHAQRDDLGKGDSPASKTTGDAGGRIACCAITWTKPAR